MLQLTWAVFQRPVVETDAVEAAHLADDRYHGHAMIRVAPFFSRT
jgi:hypothetical protein